MNDRNFSTIIEELRLTPVRIDSWREEQVGTENSGPYKAGYQAMLVRDTSEEPLVDVQSLGLVATDYYLDEFFGGADDLTSLVTGRRLGSRVYLRKSHAERLARVDSFLRAEGLFVVVASGWRHPEVQTVIKHRYAVLNGQELADRMFASVGDGLAPSPHSTGAAMDLQLRRLGSGEELPMYAEIDGDQVYGLYRLERLLGDSASEASAEVACLKNRRILYHVMCSRGVALERESDLFVEHPGEFWHFGEGDPLSAYLRREPFARYGLAFPDGLAPGVAEATP